MASAGNDETQTEDQREVIYRSMPDESDGGKLSTGILLALDAVPGYDVENSETVVFDHIDLDALDELFSPVSGKPRRGAVTFPIEDYEITATAAGEVTITTR